MWSFTREGGSSAEVAADDAMGGGAQRPLSSGHVLHLSTLWRKPDMKSGDERSSVNFVNRSDACSIRVRTKAAGDVFGRQNISPSKAKFGC